MARRDLRPLAGALAGTVAGTLGARAVSGPTLVEWPRPVRPALAVLVGATTGSAAAVAAVALAGAVSGAGRDEGPPPVSRRPSGVGLTVGLAATAAGFLAAGAGVRQARRLVRARMMAQGRDIEAAFAAPPDLTTVSGGTGSLVPYPSVGREGARFVNLPASPAAIEQVTGLPPVAVPVRVFVGYDAAATVEDRVRLAMAELDRTGAFDRRVLLVEAPAGSGFANSTPVEVIEMLTGGNCAVVSVGYGLLPSFMSLDRVEVAARTQRLLLEAVADRWRSRPAGQRPRILLYGESLGAKVQQAALPDGVADLDRFHVDAALWVGTPGGRAADAFHGQVAAVAARVDRPEQIPDVVRDPYPRVWFLEHDGDPVVRFRPDLLVRRPEWLSHHPRGRNVPEEMAWRPGLTWVTTLVDTLFATNVRPGQFASLGHDYREDLGAVVRAAYRLSADADESARLEAELRQAEVDRAALIDAAGG